MLAYSTRTMLQGSSLNKYLVEICRNTRIEIMFLKID